MLALTSGCAINGFGYRGFKACLCASVSTLYS